MPYSKPTRRDGWALVVTIHFVNALIDGYNLLHAIGLANRNLPAKGLERARIRLLDWLAERASGHTLRVIFDGQNSAAPSAESDHRGVKVRFSFRQTADELIEEIIRVEPMPDRITVVSNDGQVREAARRRNCTVLTCEEFVDELNAKRAPAAKPAPRDEREPATPEEMAAWLDAFSRPKPRRG